MIRQIFVTRYQNEHQFGTCSRCVVHIGWWLWWRRQTPVVIISMSVSCMLVVGNKVLISEKLCILFHFFAFRLHRRQQFLPVWVLGAAVGFSLRFALENTIVRQLCEVGDGWNIVIGVGRIERICIVRVWRTAVFWCKRIPGRAENGKWNVQLYFWSSNVST